MNNKGIVRYTKKNTRERARDEKQNKKNVYQQIKKNQNDKAFIHHIYAQGQSARAHVCVLLRDRVLDVYIYIYIEKTKKTLYKNMRQIRKMKNPIFLLCLWIQMIGFFHCLTTHG